MRALFLVALLSVSCSEGGNGTPVFGKDLGTGGGGICPSHPKQCAGTCCGSMCTDTTLDVSNCGMCGNKCAAGLICKGGTCGCLPSGAACGMAQSCCPNTGCHSLDSDMNNCGSCGHACTGDGIKCMGGQCVCGNTGGPCGAGEMCCGGQCKTNCTPVSMPDMAMGTMTGLPLCDCTGLIPILGNQCPISSQCVQNNCCAENLPPLSIGNAPCNDPTPCQTSSTPQ